MQGNQQLEQGVIDQSNVQNTTGENSGVSNQVDNSSVSNQQVLEQNQSTNSVEKTFTQSQVNGMMSREKKQGRESAYRELGIDPNDEKQMAIFKAFVESQNAGVDTEVELAKSEAKFIEAEKRAKDAEVKVEAMKLGVQPQYVDDLVTLASSRLSEEEDVKTVINEFKSKYPSWFTPENTSNNPGSTGTGSSFNTQTNSSGSGEQGIGARLAAQRRQSNSQKSSFWNK